VKAVREFGGIWRFFFFVLQIAGKRDTGKDKEAQDWMEAILGAKFPPGESYEDALKDGIILCKLINKIAPNSVPKINTTGGQFKMMENINMFQKALKSYGVPDLDVFQTVDLYEAKDVAQVTSTIFALGRAVSTTVSARRSVLIQVWFLLQCYKHAEFQGPWLGPKPADENKREFSEETLAAGQTIIGLQAGQNKGASQAGQNLGAGRKIIIGK
jgi:transgelin